MSFLEVTGEATEYLKQYLDKRITYAKLDIAEQSSVLIGQFLALLVIGGFLLLAWLFVCLGMGFFLSIYLESYVLGFALIGLMNVIIAIVFWIFKRQLITNPILPSVLKIVLRDYEH